MNKNSGRRGFTLIEILVIVAIIGILTAFVMPAAGKAIRRARALSAISDMNRILTQARLNAIKRGFQVVVQVSPDPSSGLVRLVAWEDRNPDMLQGTFVPPGGGAAQQEVQLQDFRSQGTFHVWKHGGAIDDYATGVAFNTYLNGDASLTSRIVFLPTGAIVPPEDGASLVPTTTGGRGIYLADAKGMNFFRLTIPSTLVAKARAEKWVDASTGYVPDNWSWR